MTDKIDGLYYERKKIEAGTMGTRRKSAEEQDLHYFAKSAADGKVNLFIIKPTGEPTSMLVETLTREEFDPRFKSCSTHDCELKPKSEEEIKKQKAQELVNVGEQHLEKKEYNAAAFEFGQAAKEDEENLKAHLGKGKAHMGLGEVDKAKESFEKLSEIDSLYDKENKHIFNEYGIELRKSEMYDLAIENYEKAISIDPDDEALYFNMGRAYYSSGNNEKAKESLDKAISLNADFSEAKMLRDAIANRAKK